MYLMEVVVVFHWLVQLFITTRTNLKTLDQSQILRPQVVLRNFTVISFVEQNQQASTQWPFVR